MLCLMPLPATAQSISNLATADRLAQDFGGIAQPGVVGKALKGVAKHRLSRYKQKVSFETPVDFRLLDSRFAAVGFKATVKELRSARTKGTETLYVLLFVKREGGGLDHLLKHLLVLDQATEVAGYTAMTDSALAARFRQAGVGVKLAEASKATPPPRPKKTLVPIVPVITGDSIRSGVVKEAYIDDAIARDSELRQALSRYAKKTDLLRPAPVMKAGAGSPQLQMRVAALEAQVSALEALLSNVTRKGGNIYFNGVNLYVTNGTGQTDKVNGKGNLIIGYGSTGKGSHNLVVGTGNQYQGSGGLVTGQGNVLEGDNGVALGGSQNRVSGDNSVVVGGKANSTPGTYATILGGSENNAKGEFASINGQRGRTKGGKNPHFSSQKTNE